MKIRSIFFIIFIGVLFSACEENNAKKEQIKAPKVVKLFKVGSNISKDSYSYPAIIYPFRTTQMSFEVSGKIVEFNKKEGDFVKKGELIAKLDDTLYRSNLDAAKANYEKAKSDYGRFKKLYESKNISQSQFESVNQNYKIAKANYEVAKKNFEDTKIKAEFDGIVAKKYIEDYAHIVAKQKIIELQDTSSLKVKFFIPENDILKSQKQIDIKQVDKLMDFYISFSLDEKVYKAKFLEVATQAQKITRTFETTLAIEKPKDKTVFSGMTAKVSIVPKQTKSQKLYIPFHALFTDSTNNKFVWLVDEKNMVHKTKVETKEIYKDYIELIKGLKKGDTIVISGVSYLNDKDKIKEYKKLGE